MFFLTPPSPVFLFQKYLNIRNFLSYYSNGEFWKFRLQTVGAHPKDREADREANGAREGFKGIGVPAGLTAFAALRVPT